MTDAPPKIRLYLEGDLSAGAKLALGKDHANYLFNVMRLEAGAEIRAFNGQDGEWRAKVLHAGKRAGVLEMTQKLREAETPPDLWLLFAPIKKARTDFIVEKACELGCRRISPVFTERTNSERVKQERLQAHVVEAAEQCGLVAVPEVAEPQSLATMLQDWPPERTLYFCDEAGGAPTLTKAAQPGPAAILIGPEGGFSEQEANKLKSLEFVRPVSLGPRILRADTAAAAALAIWQSQAGDWK